MKKILVISHDASLTGAPILLLHVIRLLKSQYEFKILLKRGGILESEFREISTTIILKNKGYSEKKSIIFMIGDRLSYLFNQIRAISLFYSADAILSNTITNGRLLHRYRAFKKPVITYVHELQSVMEYFNSLRDTPYSLRYSKVFVYPSNAVKKNLIDNWGVLEKKLVFFPYFFPSEKFSFSTEIKNKLRNDWMLKWNLPETAKMVVGMGVVSIRKGTDKFLEIANDVIKRDENVHFFWIGDFDFQHFSQQIKSNCDAGKYGDRIIFTGRMAYSYTNLLPFDLFFLSSTEDPYPLVVLEAAYQQVPTICFRNSGGAAELLNDGAGYILENDSRDNAVENILTILKNDGDLIQKGKIVKEKVTKLHSDVSRVSKIFDNVVKSILD